MKKLFLTVIAVVVFITTPVLSFGQQELKDEKKISYSFINEYGFDAALGNFDVTSVFVNGVCFNKTQDHLGIGVGYETQGTFNKHCIPLFVNYRHYFPTAKKIKPFVNFAVGPRMLFWTEPRWYIFDERRFVAPSVKQTYFGIGLYNTIAGGFKVNAFSLSSGIYLKSFGGNELNFGIEVKAGFTL
jgi:hypothetical protein